MFFKKNQLIIQYIDNVKFPLDNMDIIMSSDTGMRLEYKNTELFIIPVFIEINILWRLVEESSYRFYSVILEVTSLEYISKYLQDNYQIILSQKNLYPLLAYQINRKI